MSVDERREELKLWREDNSRRSEEVIEHWEECIKEEMDNLGEEKWMLLEQVCIAAMDTYRPDIVDFILTKLIEKFSINSLRVRRLCAMQHEMREEWEDALELLDSIIELDEANSSARKRKVAIYRAQGDIPKAIYELNKYIKLYQSDLEAWQELCDLYIMEQDYQKAVFCSEEVVLHHPHNHLYHQKVADIRYTIGGFEQLELAKQYYSQAVKLSPSNMRALYGLLITSTQLAANQKCSQPKRKEFAKVAFWTSKQISARYNSVGAEEKGSQLPVIEGLISQLEITKSPEI